jgi:D-xylose transport system substrate-binding protein
MMGVLFVSCGGGTTDTAAAKVKIGISMSDYATERWKVEADLMAEQLGALGYETIVQGANQDAKVQNDQINQMVTQGCKVIIVVAQDGVAVAAATEAAAAAGVQVIAYDRLIKSDKLAAYLTFDNVEVGRQQANGVLAVKNKGNVVFLGGSPDDNNAHLFQQGQLEVAQPLIDKGDLVLVDKQWVPNWDRGNAQKLMENILNKAKNKVDLVIASNDGTALGAITAMRAVGLAGKVPISGQDATADGCNSIVKGELTVTILKNFKKYLVPAVVSLADKLAKGETDSSLVANDLGVLTGDATMNGKTVMCSFAPVTLVTKDNVYAEVVQSGFQTKADVYKDIDPSLIPAD